MFSFRARLVAVFTCSIFAFTTVACSHVVTIDSEPPGATIYVNGEKLGTAPVSYTEKTGWDKSYEISAKKKGYSKTRKRLTQDSWNVPLMAGSILGFFCCTFPIVGLYFSKQLPDHVIVRLERKGRSKRSRDADVDTDRGGDGDGDYDYGY
ncbi:MAG: PEGA domain-containing protein [Deltaproteobacteria bacterium]|nr:PEGA domain-containing protein [Deltaproteobacteria bacterium]